MKNDTLNCVLFCPKNEWNPHSNTLSFSWYGLCGAKTKFINNNKIDNIGINIIKKVVLVIYRLKSINAIRLARFSNLSGTKINNDIINVIIDIDKLK